MKMIKAEILPVNCVMTLKDITDILGLQHSKALRKIERLADESEDFGQLAKMDSSYSIGNGAIKTVQTLALTELQAVAVGARLDNKNLMKVIKRLKELEGGKRPKTYVAALRAYADEVERNEQIALELQKSNEQLEVVETVLVEITEERDELAELQEYLNVMEDKGTVWNMGAFASEIIGKDPRITQRIGRTRLMQILRDLKYLQSQTINKTLPYRHHQPHYFIVDKDENGYPFACITAKGIKQILPEIVNCLN